MQSYFFTSVMYLSIIGCGTIQILQANNIVCLSLIYILFSVAPSLTSSIALCLLRKSGYIYIYICVCAGGRACVCALLLLQELGKSVYFTRNHQLWL